MKIIKLFGSLLLLASVSFIANGGPADPVELTALCNVHDAAVRNAAAPLTKRYLEELGALKTKLTAAGDAEEVAAVQREIDLATARLNGPAGNPPKSIDDNVGPAVALPASTGPVATPLPAAEVQPKPADPGWTDITPTLTGGQRTPSGIILREAPPMTKQRTQSKNRYRPPLEIEYVCQTDSTNIRLSYACDQMIFNWESNQDQLRIDGGPAAGQYRNGAGRIPANKFITIRQVIEPGKMDVFVDAQLRASWGADFSKVDSPIAVFSGANSTVTVKSVRIRSNTPRERPTTIAQVPAAATGGKGTAGMINPIGKWLWNGGPIEIKPGGVLIATIPGNVYKYKWAPIDKDSIRVWWGDAGEHIATFAPDRRTFTIIKASNGTRQQGGRKVDN